jgi:thiol-disulfide isomerase/thioredoxin
MSAHTIVTLFLVCQTPSGSGGDPPKVKGFAQTGAATPDSGGNAGALADRVVEIARQLKDHPNDAKLLDQYKRVAQKRFGQLVQTGQGPAEEFAERMKTFLEGLGPNEKEAKSLIADLKETADFYRRIVQAKRYQFDQLRRKLSREPNDIELMLVYEVKIQTDFNSLMNRDPEAVASGLAKEKEFLASLREKTTDARVGKVIESLRKGVIPSMELRLAGYVDREGLIGQNAPALDDASAWINAERGAQPQTRGKVLLVDFWAVWCGPCIASFPKLQAWDKEFSDRGLLIVGVTGYYDYLWDDTTGSVKHAGAAVPHEQEKKMVEKFVKQHQLTFPVVIEQGRVISQKYRVNTIPQVVLIDRRGKVRMIRVGNTADIHRDISAMISTLLAEAP